MFDFFTDIGSGISDAVEAVGSGIETALEYTFDVDDGLVGDVFGWADSALTDPAFFGDPSQTQSLASYTGYGEAINEIPTEAIAEASKDAVIQPFSDADKGLLGGFLSKDDVKGGLLAGAKEIYRRSREKDIMDWREEMMLKQIQERKRHHGAYYVKSDVRPAYAAPKGK